MNKFFASLLLMMLICVSYAQIYKWVDSQGNVHFSDTPHEGAEQLTLPDTQSYSSPVPPATTPQQTEPAPETKKHIYNKIVIAQPENGATIRNNQGFVAVTVKVDPDLYPGDKLQMIFDSAPLGEPQTNPLFQLNGIYRGSHTIQVQIIDEKQEVIMSTDPITVYVFRPRVGMGTSNGAH